jgi:hypothetical protein
MMNVATSVRDRKPKAEVKCLYDDVMTLKMAIEEAIIRGQKSPDLLGDIPRSDVVIDEDFAMTCADAGAGVAGWVDDF